MNGPNNPKAPLFHRRHFLAGMGVAATAMFTSANETNGVTSATKKMPSKSGKSEVLSTQTLEDTLLGSSYLGCGGGGGLKEARALIKEDLDAGLLFQQLQVEDLQDNGIAASPYVIATLAPVNEAMQKRLDSIKTIDEMPTIASFRLLEKYLDQPFSAVIVGEIGPLSTAEALSLGARLGLPFLDADTVGRATPEINQHSVRVAGHAITPAAAVTPFGDEIILSHVNDPTREEDVFRAVSVVSQLVGVTDAAITGAVAKSPHTLVQKSLTLSANIGRAVREAIAGDTDPIEAARHAGDGYLLFEGTVDQFNWADRDGFLWGDVYLDGVGTFGGKKLKLDYKNEHLVANLDGTVIATCPDLITVIDRKTFEGIGNPEFHKGQRVAVLGYRAPELWRRKEGLAVFSPRYFGYDVDYIPIEQRLSS